MLSLEAGRGKVLVHGLLLYQIHAIAQGIFIVIFTSQLVKTGRVHVHATLRIQKVVHVVPMHFRWFLIVLRSSESFSLDLIYRAVLILQLLLLLIKKIVERECRWHGARG